MPEHQLTKSSYVQGTRCKKALFLAKHHPELAKPLSRGDLKLKRDGIQVGEYVRGLHPEGVLITSKEMARAVEQTKKEIEAGALVLFEAAFCHDGVGIRADMLKRETVDSAWKLYEVKSSTSLDPDTMKEYSRDIAIQYWVLTKSGAPLEGAYLMQLNNRCAYPDLSDLFTLKDMKEEINSLLGDIPKTLEELKQVITQDAEPEMDIGPYCLKPHPCPFKGYCWKDVPKPGIFEIPGCKKRWEFYQQGKVSIDDLSEKDYKNKTQKRALRCYQTNEPFLDHDKLKKVLSKWKWPLSYFDIEAITYPIPRFDGTTPWQSLPFQFSCHIQHEMEGKLIHEEFLHQEPGDPRRNFIKKLLEVLPEKGSIVVYYKPFEIGRLKEFARDFPEYEQEMQSLIKRVVDLMLVIQECVYHPLFLGSFSIKKVAPALLGSEASYDALGVKDGMDAMVSFLEMLEPSSKKEKISHDLLEYCKQDTLLMVKLHHHLLNQVRSIPRV